MVNLHLQCEKYILGLTVAQGLLNHSVLYVTARVHEKQKQILYTEIQNRYTRLMS
jgi:hypothetical protein